MYTWPNFLACAKGTLVWPVSWWEVQVLAESAKANSTLPSAHSGVHIGVAVDNILNSGWRLHASACSSPQRRSMVVIINGEIVPDSDPRARARRQQHGPPQAPASSSSSSWQGKAYTTRAGLYEQPPAPAAASRGAISSGGAMSPPSSPLDMLADLLKIRGKTLRIPPVPAPLSLPESQVELVYVLLLGGAALIFGWRVLAVAAVGYVIVKRQQVPRHTQAAAAAAATGGGGEGRRRD